MITHPTIIDREPLQVRSDERYVCIVGRTKRYAGTPQQAYEAWASISGVGRWHRKVYGFNVCKLVLWTPHMDTI